MSQHQPNPPQTNPKKTALTQALTCTTCTYPPPHFDNLYNDLTSGKYNFLRDPPFNSLSPCLSSSSSSSPGEEDEGEYEDGISPLDNSILPPEIGYRDIMTEEQSGRYRELVLGGVSGVIQEGTATEARRTKEPAEDLKTEILLRFYQVDYHIHLHYLSGRSVLALCRDVADVHALRRWRWDIMTSETERERDRAKRQKQKRMRNRGWSGWPVDNPEMLDLVALWRKRWQERRERVDLVRARWVWIMEERRVQRARILRLTQGEVQW